MADSYLVPSLSCINFPTSKQQIFPPLTSPFSTFSSTIFRSFRHFYSMVPSGFSSMQTLCHCSSNSTPNCSVPNSPHNYFPSLLVFSGGTAFNGVVEELKKLTTSVAHVLPVSDDGGSTAEIVRVLGGPAVGDIRSRCLRLSDQSTLEAQAVRTLLGYRLPLDAQQAKLEWYEIVEGKHPLWKDVSKAYRETIRAFLVYFQTQLWIPTERNCNASRISLFIIDINNEISGSSVDRYSNVLRNLSVLVMEGARTFFCSLDAAIFLFSRVSEIPTESLVLPVISTNDRLTLGCELGDGTIVRGQNEISHPTSGHVELINKQISSAPELPSRIKRVFYMSSEGSNLLHEVFPPVNPDVFEQLKSVDCIVFAMGSLFTSICPSLVLLGVGEIICSRSCPKVLLLNGTHDRETSGFTASCFVTAISDSLNRTYGGTHNRLSNSPNKYINTVFVPRDGKIPVDTNSLAIQGIRVVTVDSIHDPRVGIIFEPRSLIQALAELLSESMREDVELKS